MLDSARFSLALEVVGSVSPVPSSETLADFLELLVRWNRRTNLVSRASEPSDLLADALVDAAALTRVLEAGDGKVADLGAGAGLVAFALALLAPGLDLVLVESNAHKVDFLRRATALFSGRGIGGFEVVDARLEELDEGTLWRAAFSRAVWPPTQGWKKAAPHLIPGGLYTALAGPDTTAPRGWRRADYAELFPHPAGYGSRSLLWRYK